jgi:hypothetical protein
MLILGAVIGVVFVAVFPLGTAIVFGSGLLIGYVLGKNA